MSSSATNLPVTKQVRYVLTFVACAVVAVAGVVLLLVTTVPGGEGNFGVAKLLPFILVFGSAALFCLIWFPANLGVFFWRRRRRVDETKAVIVLSGVVFALCLAAIGAFFYLAHSPKAYSPPPPQRQIELKDVKSLIDAFCARERRGEDLGPADGVFASMEQIIYLSPPEVVDYTADNLDDRSGFLWVIAGSPTCTPRLFNRFLSVPSTHLSLAKNRAAPPEVLQALSHSTNSAVRENVAANLNSPDVILRQLAVDSDPNVRNAAATTLNTKGHPK